MPATEPAWYTTPKERFDAAASPEAAPKVTPGATICDTRAAIERFRQIALLQALKLMSMGIRVSPQSPLKIARSDYGIKARTAISAHKQLKEKMVEMRIIEP